MGPIPDRSGDPKRKVSTGFPGLDETHAPSLKGEPLNPPKGSGTGSVSKTRPMGVKVAPMTEAEKTADRIARMKALKRRIKNMPAAQQPKVHPNNVHGKKMK